MYTVKCFKGKYAFLIEQFDQHAHVKRSKRKPGRIFNWLIAPPAHIKNVRANL